MADVVTNISNQAGLNSWLSGLPTSDDGNLHVGNITVAGDYTLGEVPAKVVHYLIKADDTVAYDFKSPNDPHVAIISTAQCFYPRSTLNPCEIEGVRLDSSSTSLDVVQSGTFENSHVKIRKCRLIGGKNGCGNSSAGSTVSVENCVITDAQEFGIRGASSGVSATHCVVADCNKSLNGFRGGIQSIAGTTFDSCVAYNNGNVDWYETNGNANNCASKDTSAFGADNVTNVVDSDFTNIASNIWTSSNGGALDGTGSGGSDIGLQLIAINNITVTTPSEWYIKQRAVSTNTGDITITGTYSGAVTPTAIEASFNGGVFVTIDASPNGGSYSGTLSNQPVGHGDLVVRFVNDTSITSTRANIAIGIKVLFWGQSNFSGRATNAQVYTGANGFFHKYTVTNDVWSEGSDPFDTATVNGSLFPILANHFQSDKNVPVGFVGVAQGSTTLSQWQSGETLNTRMLDYITNSGGAEFEAITSWIGESDAGAGTSEADFKNQYNAVIDQLEVLTGVKSVLCGIAQELVGSDNVRQWTQDLVTSNPNAIGYVNMYSIFQAVHYETNQETADVAQALYDGLNTAFFSSTFNMTNTNVPDGVYNVDFYNVVDKTLIVNDDVTFSGGDASHILTVDSGTRVFMFEDSLTPSSSGICYVGDTE